MSDFSNDWHTLSIDEACRALDSTADGLSAAQADLRLQAHGPNELEAPERVSPWRMLAAQFKNVLIVVLLIATAISAALGHAIESIAIAVIVGFAIVLGFVQEFRAERAIAMLRRMVAPTAVVERDGAERTIPATELVPGDVITVTAGAKVPADARLLEAYSLKVDESVLTGESLAVAKRADWIGDTDASLGDRENLLYSGTTVTFGRARAVVVATGMRTAFGQISGMLATLEDPETPLQRALDKLGRTLSLIALGVVVVVVALGLLRNEPLLDMLLFGIALAVAVVPEALPAVVTISLALGIQRMAKRNALIRYLPAVETLGSATVICSDKTGTLTKDEMTVRRIYVDDVLVDVSGSGYTPIGEFTLSGRAIEPTGTLRGLLESGVLANDADLVEHDAVWDTHGDPSEAALVALGAKAGIDKKGLEQSKPRVDEIPFSSERKRMTTLHRDGERLTAHSKGAPEVIVADCDRRLFDGEIRPLTETDRRTIMSNAAELAEQALRVLAVATKLGAERSTAESEMVFLGLVGLMDPPRPEAADAIRVCKAAGIKPIMITGDHPETGAAIAREIGLLTSGRVVTGSELNAMSDEALENDIEAIEVYARVSPEQKIRVVDAWQNRGAVVAVTGDGINDAPALKKADIGIAMGLTGTDVSREAADMTLTDDNFASIVSAIGEGRRVFGNIKKFLMFLLSANIGEIGLIAVTALAGLPLPLTAVQILYINLATDGLPALALAADPAESGHMQRPPRDPKRSIFSASVVTLLALGGLWSTLIGFSLFVGLLDSGRALEEAMAMTFLAFVLIELFIAYSFRSVREPIVNAPFANRWLNMAVVWELGLLLVIVYVPMLRAPFGTFSLTAIDWAIVIGLAATIVPVLEIGKAVVRRRGRIVQTDSQKTVELQ
jgi:Ca2+-transporting ATPase